MSGGFASNDAKIDPGFRRLLLDHSVDKCPFMFCITVSFSYSTNVSSMIESDFISFLL